MGEAALPLGEAIMLSVDTMKQSSLGVMPLAMSVVHAVSNLSGWYTCQGQEALMPEDEFTSNALQFETYIAERMPAMQLLYMVLGRAPYMFDGFGSEGGVATCMGMVGWRTTAVERKNKKKHFTSHPNCSFVQADALTYDLGGFDACKCLSSCQSFSPAKNIHL